MNILIATIKSWNIKNAHVFKEKYAETHNIYVINNKEDLTFERIKEINPKYIFFPHWSWIIAEKIYSNYECIVFHMTDLPFGRGGSPLQNLISRGFTETKISAIRVCRELDAGDIYLKYPLSLYGTAEEIFMRASKIIYNKMIPQIIENNVTPSPQKGEVVIFKRRTPKDSLLIKTDNLEKVYDFIRMLDAEGYPKAYIEYSGLKFEFSRASLKNDRIIAEVEIKKSRTSK